MDYLIKLALSYSNRHILNASVSFISRPGHYYTPVTGSEIVDVEAGFKPIYGDFNAQQLGDYSALDMTLNKLISWHNTLIVPFFTLTNILNRKNENIPVYSEDYEKIVGSRHYQERLVYFGVQVSFNH